MQIIYVTQDFKLDLATAKHRFDKHWKNKKTTWSALLKKISEPHYTAETLTEYAALPKTRQDEIKDVGGYVGGYLTNGTRKNENVLHRQVITLDIDHGDGREWELFQTLYDTAACVYSTHKHTPATPRMRLLMPLSREVTSDEYIAIARRIAGIIGIESFDLTTFEPARLMYWPSSSKDGEYFFEYQDGPALDADEVLGTYVNWRDSSEWPISVRASAHVNKAMKKAGEPTEKPGIVGVFNRTFDIHQAIELYLDGVYEDAGPGRYTYVNGSTAGGLVIYDDKFAFSHHGTDPVGGKLCNAFDLVRLHKFGVHDEDATDGTPVNRLPSYKMMNDFALGIGDVKHQLAHERITSASEDFADWETSDDSDESAGSSPEKRINENVDWAEKMDADAKGNYLSTINNVKLVLENDDIFRDLFAFDLLAHLPVATRNLPWRKITPKSAGITDDDLAFIRLYFEKTYGITSTPKIDDGFAIVTSSRSFNPVAKYLESLTWDGVPRVDALLCDFLGAEHSEYTYTVTRKCLCGAVARAFQPGIKYDNVLVTTGVQGTGKSYVFDKLGGHWFSDTFNTFHGKEAIEQLHGAWIIEIGELSNMRRADANTVKAFISKKEDRVRGAFKRRVEVSPRMCIFVGTTNEDDFLKDSSGNRRFWPVRTHEYRATRDKFTELTQEYVGQVWAEAVALYRAGEPLFLNLQQKDAATEAQISHLQRDERTGVIAEYLDALLPVNWGALYPYERRGWYTNTDDLQPAGELVRNSVSAIEIFVEVFGGQLRDFNRRASSEIREIMDKMPGWEYDAQLIKIKGYGPQRCYLRVQDEL